MWGAREEDAHSSNHHTYFLLLLLLFITITVDLGIGGYISLYFYQFFVFGAFKLSLLLHKEYSRLL
jgi:hypothetical protein